MITSKNIFQHELIGLYLEVVHSSNESIVGLSGNVIDETKKTLSIELISNEKDSEIAEEKIIPKNVSIFHFKLPNDEWVEIDGKILVNRPEDRIKKKYKKI
jgi:ribonuclease P protein subunit POP4